MRIKISLLFFILTLSFATHCHALTLKSKFSHAEKGDFIVCESKGSLSLVLIKSCDSKSMILEEISFPKGAKPRKMGIESWQDWLNQGAKGHTSWTAIEIDLTKTDIMECFSYSRDAWLALSSGDSFLLRLVDLHLEQVPDHERQKIGPPPEKGPDKRKTWDPPLVYDGKRQSKRQFEVYHIRWPKDDTPLSNKELEIFFNETDKLFPFPYLMRIRNENNLSLTFRVLDSGKGLVSPKEELPRRAFLLKRTSFDQKDFLEIEVVAPKYYKSFNFQAIDAFSPSFETIDLPFEVVREEEKVVFKIEKSLLQERLKSNHSYSFAISTESPAKVTIRTRDLFSP